MTRATAENRVAQAGDICLAPLRLGAVARVSNLLYRRIPFGKRSDYGALLELARSGGLEIRDTAGWKPAIR